MNLRRSLKAAITAFKHPSALDPITVEVIREVEVIKEVPQQQAPPKLVGTPGQRFRVVHYYDWKHTILYPTREGQDRGAEARKVYEETIPQFVGETVSLFDGEEERSRKTGGG